MKPEIIFYLCYSLVAVFAIVFIDAIIVIAYYKASGVESKKEIFSEILFFFQKSNSQHVLNTQSTELQRTETESFIKNMTLMTKLLYALIIVFVILFMATIVAIGMVKTSLGT